MSSASNIAGFLALVGLGVGGGYLAFRYWDEISEEIEKLKSEKRRLRGRITELDSDDMDAIDQDDLETKGWRS